MLGEMAGKIEKTRRNLEEIGHSAEDVSANEFHDYMTGEIFSDDKTTLEDVLGNEFLMVHEVSETNELKKMKRPIDKRVIVDSPRHVIYETHFARWNWSLNVPCSKRTTLGSDFDWNSISAS
jgi:hypothetical protein